MTEKTPNQFDWATSRGEKWRKELKALEAMLEPLVETFLAQTGLERPLRIADIGCGGGATTFAIAGHAPEGSVVDGFDISPALVEAARGRVASEAAQPSFRLANVESTPLPGDAYDLIVSRFGVMFFKDPPAAFANIRSWLASNGRVMFAVWGTPAGNPWASEVRQVVERFVEVPVSPPDAPGPFRYGEIGVFTDLLEEAGFVDVHAEPWQGRMPLGGGLSAEGAARFVIEAFGIAEPLAEVDEDVREQGEQALVEHFRGYEDGGVVLMDASAWFVHAKA